jgi:hypothetical protein
MTHGGRNRGGSGAIVSEVGLRAGLERNEDHRATACIDEAVER